MLLPERLNNGRLRRIVQNAKTDYVYSLQTTHQTVPNLKFVFDNGLGFDAHPADWFEAFLPQKRDDHPGTHPIMVSIGDLTTWTNVKALFSHAGEGGGKYKNFKPFSIDEIRSFIGLYLFHGLSHHVISLVV